ncbi:N-acetylmuramic acid 6-phosphate etherase [Viridibacillus sp. NPDC096237]|uniref:N-acetylmuramic acid 6-phosphate etherase n=1 Tax=Viridibacillus sp. NPDC096237 TaxID=3390721 RepID=UPI003D06FE61
MGRNPKLKTEAYHRETTNLDLMSVAEIIKLMNQDDLKIPQAIERVLPEIEKTIRVVHHSLEKGGRLFYVGAGTSGRIGLLDAVECPPTFSTSPEVVQAILAGGIDAVVLAIEGAEDDEQWGQLSLKEHGLTEHDVVIGIAASGSTPFVKGALVYARSVGAKTMSLTSNPNSIISEYTDIAIEVDTGPEILTGSTRLKAASAHKMVLNMISTATMVQLGKVYKNLMVDLHASNNKLKERAKRIVCEATEVTYEQAEQVLVKTGYEVKPAIVMLLTQSTLNEAKQYLENSKGHVRAAIQQKDL